MAEPTYDEKRARMTAALEIERDTLYRDIESRAASRAIDEVLKSPDSLVRLYDILAKGMGNA